MKSIIRLWPILMLFAFGKNSFAANRYWVHKPFYENFFSTASELSDWKLIEDNGTGGWALTGNGTALLTMDNSAGGYANRLFNVNGVPARLFPLDRLNGRVEIMVKAITGVNQRIFVQVQQFNSSNTYLSEFSVLASQSSTGFFSINLNAFTWDAAADKVRFIIGGENYSGQQGTVEFDYFSYSNGNGDWNNTANWSSTSNGTAGASIPGASDVAIFDGAGGNNGSCLLGSATSIQGIQIGSGYSGNLDLQAYQLTVGTAGANIAGGGIAGNGSTIYINGDIIISGGAFKNANGINYSRGNMTITGGVLDFSTGQIIMDAAVDQSFSSTLTDPLHKVVINKSSGNVNFNSDILIADSLVLTQGILNTNGNTIRLGTSVSSIGKLITGGGRINGNFKRWISTSTTGNLDFPLGNSTTNALLTLTMNTAPATGGSITAVYNDASPAFTNVQFPDVLNTTTIIKRSTSNWNIQTTGLGGGAYSLSATNNNLAAFTNINELHLTLSGSAIGTHVATTGTLANPVLRRSDLTAANLAQTWYASVATPVIRKISVIGSSTAAGYGATTADSSWVGRLNYYYKYQQGYVDTIYNLAVAGTTVYSGMPSTYTPPAGRPSPDVNKNVSKAISLFTDLLFAENGVTIVNFPTNGYDNFSVAEIMTALQTIYDSAVRLGNKCFITTTQPRSDGNFATSSVKRKLADIKDSIINRFGEAQTINFWDGMFNPADTTILAAYSAGDLVHLNNAGHKVLFNRVIAKNIFSVASVAATGDYRSNVSPTGLWSDASSWQVYDGTAWIAASAAPTSANGVVTVVNGDSIRMNSAVTFDQVLIESGGILAIFNSSSATTFTLNDGAGTDIVNNGKLYVSVNGTLTGAGNIQNNSGATFTLRNYGILQANTVNEGIINISGTGTIQNSTFINNGIFTLKDFTLNLNSASLINNDSLSLPNNADTWFAGTGTSYLINNPSAIIYKSNASGVANIQTAVSLTNSGSIKGIGQYNITTTQGNSGILSTGNTVGVLTVNPSFITAKNPVIDLKLRTNGAMPGTNNDEIVLSGATNTSFSGSTLKVTDNASDPVGTVYTLVNSPLGTVSGPFANVQLPTTLGNLTYNAKTITVQKVSASVLPVVWKTFTVSAENGKAILHWSTEQEMNTSHFIIERSVDGVLFNSIGKTVSVGESYSVSNYNYIDASPAAGINYYRLKQVDIDNKAVYSAVRSVKIAKQSAIIQLMQNPIKNILQFDITSENANVVITDMNGQLILKTNAPKGMQYINSGDWARGTYQLSVYEKNTLKEVRKLIKL